MSLAEHKLVANDQTSNVDQINEIHSENWAASRTHLMEDDKELMADYFVRHDFLRPSGQSSEATRETVASMIVNQGTTPACIVTKALEWIVKNKEIGRPYFLKWYTPGHVIPATLSRFRENDKSKSIGSALRLFLFPGDVDEEIQGVIGDDAVNFVAGLQRHFTYSLLSAYSFDVATGDVKFHFEKELALQRACATRWADHKFIFLDSTKFKTEGDRAYGIADMLNTANSVTIYTVHSSKDGKVIAGVAKLAEKMNFIFGPPPAQDFDVKCLRLQIVGRDDVPTKLVEYYGPVVAESSSQPADKETRLGEIIPKNTAQPIPLRGKG